jgi:class 3 adenylate cyclase
MPPVQSPEVVGERRHLTVLFSDLVGSTAIAAQLDPEEWRETVSEYHRLAADPITRFGGHVVKYLGDGVMALFGGRRRMTTTRIVRRGRDWRLSTPLRSSTNCPGAQN